jgi:capsular polysaccharide biosynthesis protein
VINANNQFYRGGMLHNHGTKLSLFQIGKVEHVEAGISLSGSHTSNWYHLLIEILPKILLTNQLPDRFQTYPILVPEGVFKHTNTEDLFKLLIGKRLFIKLERGRTYMVKKCIFIESPAIGPANVVGKTTAKPQEQHFRKEFMHSYKTFILSKVSIDSMKPLSTDPKRIFLGRNLGAHFRKYNQDEVFELLQTYGFEQVFCENHTVTEQIRMFANAEFIAGPGGAAWANILFCKPGTRALCLIPKYSNSNFASFSNIAYAFNINLECYFQESNFEDQDSLDYSTDTFIYEPSEVKLAAEKTFGSCQ